MADGADVVKRITITASGEGIESTTNSVTELGSAFDDAMQKSQNSLSGIALGLSFGAAIAGLTAVTDYIAKANKELADMDSTAHQVGLSLRDFQAVQFGGAVQGLSTSQINAGLQQSAQLLNDASRNSNSLSKELAANDISIKNANGDLISQNQLLTIAGKLVANAKNPGDQLAIAQMLGFTKEWVPLLEQGGRTMAGLGDAAQAAGAIIDDATIKRATEFDAEWKKSSAQWSVYMKAAIADMLPGIDDVITRISKIGVGGLLDAAAKPGLAALASSGIPESGGLKIGVTPEVSQAIKDFQDTDKSFWDHVVAAVTALKGAVSVIAPADVKWHSGTSPVFDNSDDAMQAGRNTTAWLAEADAYKKLQASVTAGVGGLSDGFSKVASKGNDANDAVDRAINTLARHTEQTKADTLAIGLGDAALAAYKATASETAAKQANGNQETDDQTKKFAALKVAAFDAADALAKAKVASENNRGNQTSLLSPDDVAIANKLKGIYGDDIPKALASTEAAGLRVNTALSGLSSTTSAAAVDALTSIENHSKSLGQAATTMGTAFVNALLQMLNKMLIVEPLMRSLQAGLGSLGIGGGSGSIGSTLGSAGITYGNAGTAGSNLFGPVAPSIPAFAGGTDSAPGGWSIIGENGPELMNVPTGAQILPNGTMPSGGGGSNGGPSGNNVQVNVINNADGTKATATKRSEGGIDIHSIIISAVNSHVASGGLDKTMKNRYATPLRSRGR